MPVLTKDIAAHIQLYRRCKQFRTLPNAGGIFDQDERVMEFMEIIDNEVNRIRAERAQTEEGELMKQKMLKGLPHG